MDQMNKQVVTAEVHEPVLDSPLLTESQMDNLMREIDGSLFGEMQDIDPNKPSVRRELFPCEEPPVAISLPESEEDAQSIGWLDNIELQSVSEASNDAGDVIVISDDSSDDDKLGVSMPDHRQILLNYEEDLIEKKIQIKKDIKKLKKRLAKVNEELEGVQFTLHSLYSDE